LVIFVKLLASVLLVKSVILTPVALLNSSIIVSSVFSVISVMLTPVVSAISSKVTSVSAKSLKSKPNYNTLLFPS